MIVVLFTQSKSEADQLVHNSYDENDVSRTTGTVDEQAEQEESSLWVVGTVIASVLLITAIGAIVWKRIYCKDRLEVKLTGKPAGDDFVVDKAKTVTIVPPVSDKSEPKTSVTPALNPAAKSVSTTGAKPNPTGTAADKKTDSIQPKIESREKILEKDLEKLYNVSPDEAAKYAVDNFEMCWLTGLLLKEWFFIWTIQRPSIFKPFCKHLWTESTKKADKKVVFAKLAASIFNNRLSKTEKNEVFDHVCLLATDQKQRDYLFYFDDVAAIASDYFLKNEQGVDCKVEIKQMLIRKIKQLKDKEVEDQVIHNILENVKQDCGNDENKTRKYLQDNFPDIYTEYLAFINSLFKA